MSALETVRADDLTDREAELLDQYVEVERQNYTPHEVHGMTAALYHTTTELYTAVCYDKMGLESRVGDYNAELLGKSMAEKHAVEAFKEATDYDGEVTAVVRDRSIENPTSEERMKQQHVYYEVAVFMHDPKPEA